MIKYFIMPKTYNFCTFDFVGAKRAIKYFIKNKKILIKKVKKLKKINK